MSAQFQIATEIQLPGGVLAVEKFTQIITMQHSALREIANSESGLDGGIAAKELATETINTVENLICGNDRNTAPSDSFDETLEEFKRHG